MNRPKNFRRVALGIGIMTIIGSQASLHAIIISSSQNVATAGVGHNPADFWKGVGMVGINGDYFCSGTLIKPPPDKPQTKNWVLTAAHCTYDNAFDINPIQPYPGGDYPPGSPYPDRQRRPQAPDSQNPNLGAFADNRMTFHLPLESANPAVAPHYQSVKVYRHPLYLAGDSTYDVALIELDQEVPSTAWKINEGQIADERAGAMGGLVSHVVGYGAGGHGPGGETLGYGTKREGVNFVDSFSGVNSQMLLFDFDNHAIDPAVDPVGAAGPLGSAALGVCPNPPLPDVVDNCEANTTHGDSGGPMFMLDEANNTWRVAGVTRGGNGLGMGAGGDGFGEISNDVRVRSVAGWINQTTPEPATIAFIALGLIAPVMRFRRRPMA